MLDGPYYEANPYRFDDTLAVQVSQLRRYSDVTPLRGRPAEEFMSVYFVMPDRLSYGDYDNSGAVERANYKAFRKMFAEHEDVEWTTVYGDHDTHAIVIRADADERVPEIGEALGALEKNSVLDDTTLNETEMEVYDEAWESYGDSEFVRWLEAQEQEAKYNNAREYTQQRRIPADNVEALEALEWRYTLARVAPKLDPLFDELDDEALVNFMTALGWGTEASEKERDNAWFEAVRHGSGGEQEIRYGVEVSYDFEDGLRVFLKYGVDQGKLKVAFDLLLENGGEWTPLVTEILR